MQVSMKWAVRLTANEGPEIGAKKKLDNLEVIIKRTRLETT